MSTEPSVGVVIPTYDRVKLLRRALDSVHSQTFAPETVVVVDDASPEPIKPRIEVDSEIVTVIRNDRNMGAAASRNAGVAAMDSDYVAFLDSDDYWEEKKLERQVSLLKESPDLDLVYCDQYIVDPNRGKLESGKQLPTDDLWDVLLSGWTAPNTSTLLFDRDVFQAVDGFDESIPSCQDHDVWMRVAQQQFEIGVVPEPLSYFARDADHRISHNYPERMEGVDAFLEKWEDPIVSDRSYREFRQFSRDYRARAALPLAYAALAQQDFSTLAKVVRQYLLFNPSAYRVAVSSLPTLLARLRG